MAPLKQQPAHYIIVGEHRLPLIVKKHPRARSIVVRYDAQEKCVRVTAPRYVSLKSALEFAASKASWVERQLVTRVSVPFEDGCVIPFFGSEIKLMHMGGRGVPVRVGDELRITGEKEFMARRVRDYITKEMREKAWVVASHHAEKINAQIRSVRIGDMRSLWGSCNKKGDLSLSLRLAFAPYDIFDYVICHEVSHIKHLNHSEAFWRVVERLCPDYRAHERWLNRHGSSVWAFG